MKRLILEATCDTCGDTNRRTIAEDVWEEAAIDAMENEDGWWVEEHAVTCPACQPRGTHMPAFALTSKLRIPE